MKLNNKGITLIEIIISIVLISIVLIYLFSLLVAVNDINEESDINSTYLVNKALIIKNIEEDLSNVTSDKDLEISACNISEFYTNYDVGNYFKQDSDDLLSDENRADSNKKKSI